MSRRYLEAYRHAARWKEIAAPPPSGGLHLVGNGHTGIGIPDCIRMGRKAGARAGTPLPAA